MRFVKEIFRLLDFHSTESSVTFQEICFLFFLIFAIIEIPPINTGSKSLNVRQEYNTSIDIGKTSLTKRNITALF